MYKMENNCTIPAFPLSAPYHIPAEYYREGMRVYQKKYVLKKNYIFMAIFAVLLISFVVAACMDLKNSRAWYLSLICAAALFILWYNPRKQRRNVVEAAKMMEEESYTASCDGNVLRMKICTEDSTATESRVLLEEAYVQEFEEFYLVCQGKQMFYVLPKVALELSAPEPMIEESQDEPVVE